ncbi:MAG: peptidylprolyl isomerase [Pseudomonadota bacterium]
MSFKHLSIAAGLALVVACGQSGDTAREPGFRVDSATAAVINGEPIFLSDIELEAAAQGLIDAGDPFPESHPEYQIVFDQLIDQKLLAQEALRRRLDRDDGARHRLEAARERILGNLLVENLVADQVDESAIREMYAEQVRLQQLDDEVRVRHILVDTEDVAGEVRGKIDDGEDFSALALEYSKDRVTRLDGGELGYVSPNTLEEPFASVIADTSVGETSEPFETERGWHILKVEDRRQRAPLTLEEMRPEIVTFLTFHQISRILKQLRAEADIRDGGAPPPVLSVPEDAGPAPTISEADGVEDQPDEEPEAPAPDEAPGSEDSL